MLLRSVPAIANSQQVDTVGPWPPKPAAELDTAGLALIASFESFRAKPYADLGGKATIGFGHVLKSAEASRFSSGISREMAWSLLIQDGAAAEQALQRWVSVPLNQNQFNALASFVFNVGPGAFAGSALLTQLNRGNYQAIASELMRWVHVDGKMVEGLKNRRRAEAELFEQPSD